jgi:hypothetical protein
MPIKNLHFRTLTSEAVATIANVDVQIFDDVKIAPPPFKSESLDIEMR